VFASEFEEEVGMLNKAAPISGKKPVHRILVDKDLSFKTHFSDCSYMDADNLTTGFCKVKIKSLVCSHERIIPRDVLCTKQKLLDNDLM
jgi:hypothetical protein